jgi:CRISPR-associated protein Cas2
LAIPIERVCGEPNALDGLPNCSRWIAKSITENGGFLMHRVIAYDITDDRRRAQLAKTLEGFGYRVQYSVFEAILTPAQFQQMQRAVSSLIDPTEDVVRYYTLCRSCVDRIQMTQNSRVIRPPGTVIV